MAIILTIFYFVILFNLDTDNISAMILLTICFCLIQILLLYFKIKGDLEYE